jgi:phosphoenolpyruvate---glycerone phosphotransferase subunit DhaK
MEGIRVKTVLAHDDVASAPPSEAKRRRGVAGIYFAYKVAGACADEGADLDAVAAAAQKAADNTRSMGVALSPCTVPAAGKPTFTLGENEMELGMGIHGEPGIKRSEIMSADEIATVMIDMIVNDLPFRKGDEVAILANGLGATPPEELYVLFRKAHDLLEAKGIGIHRALVGEYATSLEMAGASISLLKLDDDLKRWVDAPAFSPFLLQQRFGK